MKKNEFATFVTYIGMIAIVLLVGLLIIRPAMVEYAKNGLLPPFVLVIIAVMIAIIFNAFLLEQGHLVGAKAGGYKIISFNLLGLKFAKDNKGKTRLTLASFEGLTGETKIYPTNTKENRMSAFITFPLLSFLAEVVLCVVLIAIGKAHAYWLYVCSVIVLAIGGVIFLYNYFPARLDVETDGYRMTILNKPINKEAYNDMLLSSYNLSIGKPTGVSKIYEDVTDFTCEFNLVKVYEKLKQKDFGGAIVLLQKTIDSPNYISGNNRTFATILKLSIIILTTKKEDGKVFYQTIDDTYRRTIAELGSSVALRTFILIQGVLEGDWDETKYGLEKAAKFMDRCPDYAKEEEKTLYQFGLERIASLHPTWDLKPYSLINPEETKHE